jgi:prevent-host-death family protein
MKTINASNARQNFFNLLADTSIGDPALITSKAGNCVLVSEEEWGSVQETIYLMSNPKTRDDILKGINTPLSECEDELPW